MKDRILVFMLFAMLVGIPTCTALYAPVPAASAEPPIDRRNPNFKSQVPEEDIPEPSKYIETIYPDGTMVRQLVTPEPLSEDEPLLRCDKNVIYDGANLLGLVLFPNGQVSAMVDTNGDNRMDVEMIYEPGVIARPEDEDVFPSRYRVDLNYDGEPDRTYIDPNARGICDEIVPEDTREHDEEPATPNFDSPRKGKV